MPTRSMPCCRTRPPPTDSIEDKVLELQERKRGVIAQALEGRGGRVTMEDLAALFEGIA